MTELAEPPPPSPLSEKAPELPSKSPHAARESLFSAEFLRLLTVQMLFGLSYSSFLLLPKFLRIELNASASQIGRVMGAAPIAAAFIAPFVGDLAGRFSRVNILRFALLAEAVAAFGFCFSSEVGLITYFFRALQGLAWVVVFNLTATMAADLVPEKKMAQAIGYLGLAMLMTNAIAPGVAEPLATSFGYLPVYFTAGVLVASALFVVHGLTGARKLELPRQVGPSQALRSSRIFAVHYGSFALGIGIGSMFTYLQPFAIELGAKVVGSFFFGYVGAAIFVRTVLAEFTDRVGPARVTVASFLLYALTVGGTAFLRPDALLWVGVGLGVSHGFGYPALTATGFSVVPREARGRFMSWYTFSFNAGYAFTALLLGPWVDRFGFSAIFLANGGLIFTGAVAIFVTQMRAGALLSRG